MGKPHRAWVSAWFGDGGGGGGVVDDVWWGW